MRSTPSDLIKVGEEVQLLLGCFRGDVPFECKYHVGAKSAKWCNIISYYRKLYDLTISMMVVHIPRNKLARLAKEFFLALILD